MVCKVHGAVRLGSAWRGASCGHDAVEQIDELAIKPRATGARFPTLKLQTAQYCDDSLGPETACDTQRLAILRALASSEAAGGTSEAVSDRWRVERFVVPSG